MNIFMVGWHPEEEDFQRTKLEIRSLHSLYPSLDPESLVAEEIPRVGFFACLSHGADVAAPRSYVYRDQHDVVFFDGCLVDIEDEFKAHDAAQLARHWQDLPQRLEGQFAAVRINLDSATLEVMSDPLGNYPVYYLKRGRCWFVSNSLRLLTRVTGESEVDPEGISLFLATGGYGMDFTQFKQIKAMIPGQLLTWKKNDYNPQRVSYCKAEDFICKKKKKFAHREIINLAEDLARPLEILARHFGTLEAPITAGKDSRLMTALLMDRQIPAVYFSAGASSQKDVQIGSKIARHFGLPHKVKHHDINLLTSSWETLSQKFVAQTDGGVSLAHIANIIDQPAQISALGVHLYGIGGEFARKSIDNEKFYMHRPSLEYLQDFLFQYMAGEKRRLLLKPAVYEQVRKYTYGAIEKFWKLGFPAWDVFKARIIFERAPRWVGPNFKQVIMSTDVFSPFCIRSFARAALQVHALRRYADYLHYRMLKTLNRELWAIELETPWKTQAPLATLAGFMAKPLRSRLAVRSRLKKILGRQKKAGAGIDPGSRQFQRAAWLETNLAKIRSFCLDNSGSELWNFVDRQDFERLTVANQDTEVLRKRHQELYDIYTMFVCMDDFKSDVESSKGFGKCLTG